MTGDGAGDLHPLKPTEPFVHRRQISWGDTDTARIVYTARIPHFAMEAIEAWFVDRVGTGFYDLATEHRLGTPFVHIELDFRSPMTPRDRIATTVLLERMGRSSLTFGLTSHAEAEGRLCWSGRFICVYTNPETYKSVEVPERFRDALRSEVDLFRSLGRPGS